MKFLYKSLTILLTIQISCSYAIKERDLIGWSEEGSLATEISPSDVDVIDRKAQVTITDTRTKTKTGTVAIQNQRNIQPPGMEVISWEPRIFLYRGILTDQECDHLIKKASPRLARSGVVSENDDYDNAEGIDDVRTSDGMFFDRKEDEIIANIERKLSEWSLIPLENGEGLQVLRYKKNQSYSAHYDYFFHKDGISNGGNRLATILMYLRTPDEGGETMFPNVPVRKGQSRENGFSECAMQGAAVKSIRGDAVLFWSLRTDGTLDKGSAHASCPVIKGVKFAATKWFHVARYAMADDDEEVKAVQHVVFRPPPPPAPTWCKDDHNFCPGWAEAGECDTNPGFMLETCFLSCGRCDLMMNKLN